MTRAWIVLLAVLTVTLAACGGGEPQGPDISNPYIGGLAGLGLSFAPSQPPAEIFDNEQSEFSVGLFMENLGESAVGVGTTNPYGYVELIGINPAHFNKYPTELRKYFAPRYGTPLEDGGEPGLSLLGARRGFDGTVVPGEISIAEFSELTYQPDRVGNTELTLRANVCYEYKSYADAEICFKDNVLENLADDTICTLTGAKPFQTSGAPVQVTSVTQNPAGQDKLQVTFTIENLGEGLVFAPVSESTSFRTVFTDDLGENACQLNVNTNPNRDVVFVTVCLGNTDEQNCRNDNAFNVRCPILRGADNAGYVTMFQGAPAVVTCTIETQGRQGSRIFTDTLHVITHYTYLDFVETPIIVRDTNIGADRSVSR